MSALANAAALARVAALAIAAASVAHASPAPVKPSAVHNATKFKAMVMGNWNVIPRNCALTVYFSSIGAGIDGISRQRIERLLERDAGVRIVRPYLRGREGETLLCVETRNDAAIDSLFDRIVSMIPRRAEGRMVNVQTKTGRRFSN